MATSQQNGGIKMENSQRIRPLSQAEKCFASENYHLIGEFLKQSKLDPEEYFDVVVLDFLLSVEKYLDNPELQRKFCFKAVSYMYMKRAVFVHFRKEKALKRKSENGNDVSFEDVESFIGKSSGMENFLVLEYTETVEEIKRKLTTEQRKIFTDKLRGYSLKEIAVNNGINGKRVYKQFGKIKQIVADVMEIKQLCG